MITDRLQQLLSALGATDSEIAAFAGFDRSNISHLRNGRRRLSPDSKTTQKLAQGISLYAESRNAAGLLLSVIHPADSVGAAAHAERMEDTCSDPEQLTEMLILWLFEGSEDTPPREDPASSRREKLRRRRRTFSEHLDQSMKLAELSNIRLSRLVYADPSLISRYRKGVRTPSRDSELAVRIADVLWERIRRNEREPQLAALLRLPEEDLDRDIFAAWLYGQESSAAEDIQTTETLLESFHTFLTSPRKMLPSPERILQETEALPADDIYRGTEGFRNAVLRFLSDVLKHKAEELLLYSDEDQGWLTADPEFLGKWAALMAAAASGGTRIRIIHNIDRDLSEMNNAIKSWLPLYPSGSLESFYCRLPKGTRFSNTIFLAPGMACIRASHAAGTEEAGIYHYYTDPELLNVFRQEYLHLLENSGTLLKTSDLEPYRGDADILFMQNTLRIGTMPQELLESFDCPALTAHWRKVRDAGLRQLTSHRIIECVSLASAEDLRTGNVFVESFPGAGDTKKLRYTPEQYGMHIKNILRLLDIYPGYSFVPLPETPFPTMKLLIAKDLTRITMLEMPDSSFGFAHPLMCRAFCNYARTLVTPHVMDREKLKQRLRALYLQS